MRIHKAGWVHRLLQTLAARASEQADAARQREAETAELYDLSRDLASAADIETILSVLQKHMEQTFSRNIAVLLPDGNHLFSRVLSKEMTLNEDGF